MKNIHLLYDHIQEIPINRRKEFIDIHIKNNIINSHTLNYIASRFKHLLKFPFLKYKVRIRFDNLNFGDKITYLILDALIYDLLSRTNFEVYFEITRVEKEGVHNIGFTSTAIYRTGVRTQSHLLVKKVFLEEYRSTIINKNTFRKLLSSEELEDLFAQSKIFTDVANTLNPYLNDEEWIDSISEAVSELVCNVSSHTKGDCLLDINFNTARGNIVNNRSKEHILVNISVINFSENRLFDKLKYNIKNNIYSGEDKLYSKIYRAYNTHKGLFADRYDEDHFFMITAFQNHVTTRTTKSGSNGTGLTRLIQSIIGKAEDDYSYTLSGNNILFFKEKYLNISEDKFIGFNEENDYFNTRPGLDVIDKSALYIPGTIHNLLLIKEI
ncbi:MAG: hypothetical protein RR835_05340 [Peptostreptococcaceae bacterium]